ncbi:hypothetical protein, partial [Mesorhizobium sp. M0898]|uniref:hypothetical protein n=1 Tax=Mesorhizobium sp. M0898 TaxID=2957020 RepID=UPI0033396C76
TTVPWPLAPQSKPRSLSKTFCRTFSTLSAKLLQVHANHLVIVANSSASRAGGTGKMRGMRQINSTAGGPAAAEFPGLRFLAAACSQIPGKDR